MLIGREQLNQASRLNKNPLNQACLAKLPEGWRGDYSLHLLGLLRWGLENLEWEPYNHPDAPDTEQVEAQLLALEDGRPQWAQDWLTKNSAGDVILDPEAIVALDREEAARLLVDLLKEQMIAR